MLFWHLRGKPEKILENTQRDWMVYRPTLEYFWMLDLKEYRPITNTGFKELIILILLSLKHRVQPFTWRTVVTKQQRLISGSRIKSCHILNIYTCSVQLFYICKFLLPTTAQWIYTLLHVSADCLSHHQAVILHRHKQLTACHWMIKCTFIIAVVTDFIV